MLARSRGPEEVKRLLDLEHDNFRDLLQDRHLGVFRHRPNFTTKLQRLCIVKAKIELFLQRIRVLISAYTDVAWKQGRRAFHDVDIHDARPQIQQRNRGAGRGLVVVLIAVLQREGVNIDHRRSLAGQRQHVGVIQDLVFLHCHQQHIHRIGAILGKDLVVHVYVGNVKGNVLRRLLTDLVRQRGIIHGLHRDSLHNH